MRVRFALHVFFCLLYRFLFAHPEVKPDKKNRYFALRFTFLSDTFINFALCVLRFCLLPLALTSRAYLPFAKSAQTKPKVMRPGARQAPYMQNLSALVNFGISSDKKRSRLPA